MKLYETDGHCGDFTGTVQSCTRTPDGTYEIVLDRTAFFPEGGGQRADHGTLGGQPLLSLRTDENRSVIYHRVAQPFDIGALVEGRVDMEQRFSDMQNHTAEHIVSGTVHALYGFDNVGFHMGNDDITMDFNGLLTGEQLAAVELRANRAVYANLPVRISFHTPDTLAGKEYRSKKEMTGAVRLVEITGVDVCACCAPHVARTGEIGLIKIMGFQKYKGGTRVSMLAGARAFAVLSHRFSQVKLLSASLSSKPEELEARVAQLQQELGAQKAEKNSILRDYYALRAAQCTFQAGNILLFEKNASFEALRLFVNLLTDRTDGICAVCVPEPGDDEAYRFVMASRRADLRVASALLRDTLGATCGGRREMIQGSVAASEAALREAFAKIIAAGL